MKKKIIGGIAAVAIAALAAFNMHVNNQEEFSAISLANVEALASGESGTGYAVVNCDGHNISCQGNGEYKCCL